MKNRIKECRQVAGMSQKELAKLTGVSDPMSQTLEQIAERREELVANEVQVEADRWPRWIAGREK